MDRKTVLAYVIIIIIILLIPYYYRLIAPEQPPAIPPQEQAGGTATDTSKGAEAVTEKEAPEAPEIPEAGEEYPGETARQWFSLDANPQDVQVETALYRMTFSTRGGVVTGYRLREYKGQADGKVEMIRRDSEENLNLVLYHNGQLVDLRGVRFDTDRRRIVVPPNGEDSLSLTAVTQDGGRVEKKFIFRDDSYQTRLTIEAQGITDLDPYYELYWGSGLAITEVDTAQDIYYSKAFAYMGGELEKFDGKGDKDIHGSAEGTTEWVAQRSKYFEVAILPESRAGSGVLFEMKAQPLVGKYRPKVFGMALRMNGQLEEESARFNVYCGPIDRKLLSQVDPRLQETMNWGWAVIEPFSKAVLWSLKGLHQFIPNYGLVLILFSILVKVVVWPLTHKSTRSMGRMAALQPKMKELQEKYKGSPEKLNKAMMQLYKQEGVNPFSGCWPTLLQMPLLYALFIIFRSTIELRGAPFIFWIKDLSMPDIVATLPFSIPMYGSHVAILPIFMGITQFYMSKVMITDPKQKATMYMMPIFMVLIFNNFPSGLSLYYALFNVWTYLQQVLLRKQGVIPSAVASKS